MARRDRRMVAVPSSVWDKASQLQYDLTERTGRKVTIAEVVSRGLDCLGDAHARGAWLSPKEAAPLLEERHRQSMMSCIAQVIARFAPNEQLKGITFDPANERILIHTEGAQPVSVLAGAPLMGPERATAVN